MHIYVHVYACMHNFSWNKPLELMMHGKVIYQQALHLKILQGDQITKTKPYFLRLLLPRCERRGGSSSSTELKKSQLNHPADKILKGAIP